jgi:hypothetical protein
VNQAIGNLEDDSDDVSPARAKSRVGKLIPALAAAIVCTILILEALVAVINGRQNGDLMLIVCPILGATFFTIPAAQAWWMVIRILRGR